MDAAQPDDADNLIAWIGVGLALAALVAQWLSQRQSTRLQRYEIRLAAYREIRRYLSVCIRIGERTLDQGIELEALLRQTESLRNDLLEGRDSLRFLFGDDVFWEGERAYLTAHNIESIAVKLAHGSDAWRRRLEERTGWDLPPMTEEEARRERESLAAAILKAREYRQNFPAVFEPYLAQDRYAGVLWPGIRDRWKRTKAKTIRLIRSVRGGVGRLDPRALSVVTRSRGPRSITMGPTTGRESGSGPPSPTSEV